MQTRLHKGYVDALGESAAFKWFCEEMRKNAQRRLLGIDNTDTHALAGAVGEFKAVADLPMQLQKLSKKVGIGGNNGRTGNS